jgi:rhodanese-related sulfurtransferase/peroxiredoxin
LSLTADDGTWVKLPDFRERLHVVLVFVGDLEDPEAIRAVRTLDRAKRRLEALDAVAFGVSTARTDTLRAWRQTNGLETFFLYDPLAAASRGFRASGRVRPVCKDTTVVVGKDGSVLLSERGYTDVEALLRAIAAREGKPVPPAATSTQAPQEAVRDVDPAQALALLGEAGSPWVLVDVRTRGEFDAGHAPMARHVPVDELPHRYGELGRMDKLLFVCAAGGRSAQAAEFMVSVGAKDVCNVVGGMSAWPATGAGSAEVSGG